MLHYKHLDEMICYLEYIKSQAVLYSDSIVNIIRQKQSNDIAKRFTSLCIAETEPTIAWKEAVEQSDMFLTESEKECIINFGVDICSSSVESISENSNRNINELEKIRNILLCNRDKKTKLSTVLAVSCGLLISLIFI